VNSFILRHPGEIIRGIGIPVEAHHLQVPRAFLERRIENLNEHADGCMLELVFNLDKVDFSVLEDHKTRRVVVPPIMDDQSIHHAVSRNVKHISVIVAIPAAGESLML
jgi:hypothetical protein